MRSAALKRLVDLVGASLALAATAVPMAVIAAAIRAVMGPPVLFRQRRPGRNGEPFTIVKFRTMQVGDGDDTERITRLGAFLRSASLDELPELVNVLRGEMSLVGPRPLLEEYLTHYTAEQARRHQVRPGLTGLAQVSGRNAQGWPERLALDTWYADNWTLRLDMSILARTVLQVVRRTGISEPGEATKARFTGTPS